MLVDYCRDLKFRVVTVDLLVVVRATAFFENDIFYGDVADMLEKSKHNEKGCEIENIKVENGQQQQLADLMCCNLH